MHDKLRMQELFAGKEGFLFHPSTLSCAHEGCGVTFTSIVPDTRDSHRAHTILCGLNRSIPCFFPLPPSPRGRRPWRVGLFSLFHRSLTRFRERVVTQHTVTLVRKDSLSGYL